MSGTGRWLVGWSVCALLALIAAAVRVWPAPAMLLDPARARTFYIPSQSMEPTLRVNDRVRPLRVTRPLRRGEVVVFQGDSFVWVARVVAVGGDTVGMRAGHVVLNGATVPLRRLGEGPAIDGAATWREAERLPGEARGHVVLDGGPMPQDEFGPVRIPAGRLFMLGDDRDFAADSRFPREQDGVGLVPAGAVIGVVDRLLWSAGVREVGRPVDEPRQAGR